MRHGIHPPCAMVCSAARAPSFFATVSCASLCFAPTACVHPVALPPGAGRGCPHVVAHWCAGSTSPCPMRPTTSGSPPFFTPSLSVVVRPLFALSFPFHMLCRRGLARPDPEGPGGRRAATCCGWRAENRGGHGTPGHAASARAELVLLPAATFFVSVVAGRRRARSP